MMVIRVATLSVCVRISSVLQQQLFNIFVVNFVLTSNYGETGQYELVILWLLNYNYIKSEI